MNKQALANYLIVAFQDFSKTEQLKLSKDSKEVERLLVKSFGQDVFNLLTRESLGTWRDAWMLFEQHHGIFTHGDYFELTEN